MVFIGVDAVNRSVNELGVGITIYHFTSDDAEYDADQNLIKPSEKIKSVAVRLKPSKRDVEQSGNFAKISYDDIKLKTLSCVDVSIGDEVNICGESNKYYVTALGETRFSMTAGKIFFVSTSK